MSNLLRRLLNLLSGRRHQSSLTSAAAETAAPIGSPRERLAALATRLDAAISASEQSVAQAVNGLRSTEARLSAARADIGEWADKARQAESRRRAAESARVVDPRKVGNLDALVRTAIERSVRAERLVDELQPVLDAKNAQFAALKRDLAQLRRHREDLDERRADLLTRDSIAAAESQIAGVLTDLTAGNSNGELAQIESEIRGREAIATGLSEVAALADPEGSFDAEFHALTERHDVDARVTELREERR